MKNVEVYTLCGEGRSEQLYVLYTQLNVDNYGQPLTNIGGLHANMSFLKTRPIDILMTYTSYCYNIEYNSQRNVTTIEQFTKKILVGLGSTMLTNVIRTYLLVDYMVICHN